MKLKTEAVVLAVIITALLWTGNAALWNHTLAHDAPLGLSASDAFQHQARTESIKDIGSYRSEAPHIVYGFDDVVGFYPPVLYHLSILLAYATGLETYDAAFFMVFLLVVLAAAAMYLLLRTFNETIALLSTPLFLFLFASPFTVAYLWGQWPAVSAHVFIIAAVWAAATREKNWWLLTGVFAAAAMMTHTAGAIFLAAFLSVYGLWLFWKKKTTMFRELLQAGGLAAALASYYLIIFQGTWARFQTYDLFSVEHATQSFPTIMPGHFGWTIAVMGIGAAAMLLLKKRNVAVAFAAFLFASGLTNYLGFGFRAFQTRFLWPVYLAVFLGTAAYLLVQYAAPRTHRLAAAAVTTCALVAAIIATVDFMQPTQGLMDQARWEGLQWLRYNTAEDAEVFIVYGDLYEQTSMLYNAHRRVALPKVESIVEAMQDGQIKRTYFADVASDSGAGFPYRTGLFSFAYHANSMDWELDIDMCSRDYIVVDEATAYQNRAPLIQYNRIVKQALLQAGSEEVYSNGVVTIIRNAHKGGDCLAA